MTRGSTSHGTGSNRDVARTAALLGLTALLVAPTAPVAPAQAAVAPHIAEIHYDNAGTDTGESVEVAAEPGADLTGWTVVLYNGNDGRVYDSDPVGPANAAGFAVLGYAANGLQNGSPDGLALVRPDGVVAQFLSYEGTFTAAEGPAAGMVSTDLGVAETGSEPVGWSLQFVDGAWQQPAPSSFGSANGAAAEPDPDPAACDVEPTHTIPQVQGNGSASPLAGQQVSVRGTVVADLQAGGFGGFALQSFLGDGDPNTSDGVFVYAPGAVDVALGDVVQVSGRAVEYHGLTEVDRVQQLLVCDSGTALPAAAPLRLPADAGELEQLESMRVSPDADLTVTEVYNLNRYGEVLLAAGGRLLAPTEVAEPGDAARAVAVENARRSLLLDDGRTTNLAQAGITPPYLRPGDPVRVGDKVAAGAMEDVVLSYGFGSYRLQPADGTADATVFTPSNPRTAAPAHVGGDRRVGAFNVLNYFVTFGSGARGAPDAAELAQQEAKIVAAISALDADVVGLQEIENSAVTTPEDPYRALRTLVGALNEAVGGPEWDYVRAHEASDVITNAIIYRTDRVAPVGKPATPAESDVWDNAREPVGQAFRADGDTFTIIANHFKSKGSGSGEGNTDTGDGQGASNADRVAQAHALVDFAAQLAQSSRDADVLLVGDFNAYSKEDPIDVLTDAGYTDLNAALGAGEHTYVFQGQAGSLDHVFASRPMLAKVTAVDVWAINAVESYGYQYSGHEALYAPDAYRSSDHDPVLVGIDLARSPSGRGRQAPASGAWPGRGAAR
jgi:predicted extracellular nuclease